jgi:hypothetical protein
MSDAAWFKQHEYRRACARVRAEVIEQWNKGVLLLPDVVLRLRIEYKRLARMYR